MKIHWMSATALAICVGLAGCTTSSVPAEWMSAYDDLNMNVLNDRDRDIVACLEGKGFPGFTVVWNGGIESPPLTTEQLEPSRKATKECQSEIGPGTGELSQEALEEHYQLEVVASECLSNLGLVANSEVPSLQKYLEDYGTANHWSAFGAVADQILSDGQLRGIAAECPDPNWFLGL